MSEPEKQDARQTADVSAQRIAGIYAEALLKSADSKNQTDDVLAELGSLIGDVFRADSRLEILLSSAAIGRTHRKAIIEKVFAGRASEVFYNFIRVLNDHDRLELLRPILKSARELHDKRTRRVRVQVFSAVPLQDDQKNRLLQLAQETLKLQPVLDARVDPSLIGGMKVRVGDWQYDGSVRTRLDNIRKQVIARSGYEIQSGRDRFSSDAGN